MRVLSKSHFARCGERISRSDCNEGIHAKEGFSGKRFRKLSILVL
jgi:hypothetical protein